MVVPADPARHIQVDLSRQCLELWSGGIRQASYPVSTALNGPGEEDGSGCTPRGLHRIRIKIGENQPENTVFSGRRPTGEIYTRKLAQEYPKRDWILTRILWLTGCEPGKNRGGSTDTLRRYIYIHGCPDSEPLGEPHSHGCIRMNNRDLINLYNHIDVGTLINIQE